MKYLLPCSCGKKSPIEISQAGQSVVCSCGARLDVPALRAIRQLEPASEVAPGRVRQRGKWSILQRLLFSVGLLVAVAGFFVAGFYQWGRTNLDTKEVAWDSRLDTDLALLENMNLEEAWENWLQVRDSGIGPYQPPRFIQSRMISEFWQGFVFSGLVVGATGLALMGIAVVLSRNSIATLQKRPPPSA